MKRMSKIKAKKKAVSRPKKKIAAKKVAGRMYPGLEFSKPARRPFFYTNFVSTIDGKVAVRQPGYWPIGSGRDYEVMNELRAHADALVHGRYTAAMFPTVQSMAKPEFTKLRRRFGKKQPLLYIVVAGHPDTDLLRNLKNLEGIRPILVTREEAILPKGTEAVCEVLRLGERLVDLDLLVEYLESLGVKNVLVEGGPSLLSSFFAHDFIDEVFLTVAPKVVGGESKETLSMVEGRLLSPEQSARFELLSAKKVGHEMFLRYRVKH